MSKFIEFCICITLGLGLITAGSILFYVFMGLSLIQIGMLYRINKEEKELVNNE